MRRSEKKEDKEDKCDKNNFRNNKCARSCALWTSPRSRSMRGLLPVRREHRLVHGVQVHALRLDARLLRRQQRPVEPGQVPRRWQGQGRQAGQVLQTKAERPAARRRRCRPRGRHTDVGRDTQVCVRWCRSACIRDPQNREGPPSAAGVRLTRRGGHGFVFRGPTSVAGVGPISSPASNPGRGGGPTVTPGESACFSAVKNSPTKLLR